MGNTLSRGAGDLSSLTVSPVSLTSHSFGIRMNNKNSRWRLLNEMKNVMGERCSFRTVKFDSCNNL